MRTHELIYYICTAFHIVNCSYIIIRGSHKAAFFHARLCSMI